MRQTGSPAHRRAALAALLLATVATSGNVAFAATSAAITWDAVLHVDDVGRHAAVSPAADLLSVQLGHHDTTGRAVLRVSFLSLSESVPGGLARAFVAAGRPRAVDLRVTGGPATRALNEIAAVRLAAEGVRFVAQTVDKAAAGVWTDPDDPDAIYIDLLDDPTTSAEPWRFEIAATQPNGRGDLVSATYPADKAYAANCAFVLHGNQGIGYTDVLHGRSDDLEGSGFDEALQVHEGLNIPGNFHLSGTLMTAAEWAARNGDPVDFNAWLAAGVSAGWAGMISSAYGQHIMPFVNNEMNDWSVSIQANMVSTFYGYTPRVAWVPERVWLNTSGYPSSGVNDWIGDNWLPHGVNGVILDDDVHLTGHDNHQIHTLSANGLRLVPRDRNFTGNIIGGNGQASLDILTGLAGSGIGEFRIAVFAEDWEAASEMGGWATITPNAKETYDWIINKCAAESAWLSTWKLADALNNPDFNGSTISVTPGTYGEIGGFDGYGGGDNGWYGHWAGFVPFANGGDGSGNCAGGGGNCKNYGTIWNDAYGALLAAPDNNLSQAGWYVLMTNLHETAWHDGLGGAISGWQHKYSAHIKNAMIYAEAAHWANGEYVTTTNAYASDIDNDGYDEFVVHNDRLFGVCEGIGGRMTHLFVKGPGYDDTAIGVDNAYWADTEGDYNDVNHVGAFSEVSPFYSASPYTADVRLDGATVEIEFTYAEVTKTVRLTGGDSFFDVTYRVGPSSHWIQAGFSPSLVDLVWNGELDRVWAPDASYMGFRNPNTGLGAAFVLGTAGAAHQKEISGTLMKGDEIFGSDVFQLQLYAGPLSAPAAGETAELRTLSDLLVDSIGPAVTASRYYPVSDQWVVEFDQPATLVDASAFTVQGQLGSVVLPVSTPTAETGATGTKTFLLDAATAAAVEALIPDGAMHPALAGGAVQDAAANGNAALAAPNTIVIDVIATALTIDGHIQASEWDTAQVLADSNDSAWTASNEIDRLLVRWDADYLYVAIDGVVDANSWLLYLDVDPGSGNGETDLTAIDAWERGTSFTAPDFAPDFQYGCYQHQSIYDGDGFWQLLSPTTTQDRSGEIISAFDSYLNFGDAGGSEIAIPWQTLYGLGAGLVPVGAEIALVASITWDPEPGGELGGDSVPSNLTAALPVIDNAWTLTVDADNDGLPDVSGPSPVPQADLAAVRLLPNAPNPFNPSTTLFFAVDGSLPADVQLDIYDLRGRHVITLVEDRFAPGRHRAVWNGLDAAGQPVASGTYIARMQSRGSALARPLSLVK